jgi:hypothetical protein
MVSRHFRPTLKKAGLPTIRFHDLRHTAATLLLQEGVPVTVVSKMLGHASAKMTLDTYAHVLPDSLDEASDAMEVAIFGRQRVALASGVSVSSDKRLLQGRVQPTSSMILTSSSRR